ncbi:histidine kinase [Vibrio crassostreae]|uniref:histidine kinase n=1 Tax=Vibrio crassostreae TaxID=246167 RepID=A0A822MUU9_9VIBR|nr:HAMP domain-containing sensor histidine kinase [Vibrio crassostreae]MDH5948882.1 HAMP domain-containing histidine kinase [Vibrio crassostreae]TCN12603.1 signal transduction histidine kinase [Vibrio crassostreae]TCT64934.1 signal transduction histidine kinase [Vibrio crassostreae]TCT70385.1 signal transduction histidine kinase [Vibrio crassostreae]TCT85152.1 signal transduction histidine kinase [Vibrio crassostreae]
MKHANMNRVSIKRDIYLYLFGIVVLLTAIYSLMVSQSYHIGLNESAKYGFLYELEVAEQRYIETGQLPDYQNPTFQAFLSYSEMPTKFQQAFDWKALDNDSIYDHYQPSPDNESGQYLYAAKHQVSGKDEALYIISEYDEAIYLNLFELNPPDSVNQINNAFIAIGVLLLLLFLIIRLLIHRVTKPIITLSKWSESLDVDNTEGLTLFRYKEIDQLATQLVKSVQGERQANERESFFLRAASHELRTPIATISASGDMLVRLSETIPNSGQRAVARIQRSAISMKALVTTLLWMSRNNEIETNYEQIKLTPLLNNIIESQRYLLKNKDVDIQTKVEQEEHSLPRELTEVVLTNLVRNAFQHGGSGDINITLTEHQFEVTNRLDDENLTNDSEQQTSFGIGLELIDRVCQNQGWRFTHETHNNEFIVKVML